MVGKLVSFWGPAHFRFSGAKRLLAVMDGANVAAPPWPDELHGEHGDFFQLTPPKTNGWISQNDGLEKVIPF